MAADNLPDMDVMQSALEDVARLREQFAATARQMTNTDLTMQAIVDRTHCRAMMSELKRRATAGDEEARGCGAMADHVMRSAVVDEAVGIIERRRPTQEDLVNRAMDVNGAKWIKDQQAEPSERPAPADPDATSHPDT